MEQEGVEFRTGCEAESTSGRGYVKEFDAVVLACGTALTRDIKVPGREARGIHFAVDYLSAATRSVLSGKLPAADYCAKDKDVLVIGGGDTGNDCVGTAVRQGAKSVTQLEMMPKQPEARDASMEWPIWPRLYKVDYGQEEAAALFGSDPRIYQTTVTKFTAAAAGLVSGAELVSLEPKTDPATGRLNMASVEGSERMVPAQLVLIAAGFIGADPKIAEARRGRGRRGNVDARGATDRTPDCFCRRRYRARAVLVCGYPRGREPPPQWTTNRWAIPTECDRRENSSRHLRRQVFIRLLFGAVPMEISAQRAAAGLTAAAFLSTQPIIKYIQLKIIIIIDRKIDNYCFKHKNAENLLHNLQQACKYPFLIRNNKTLSVLTLIIFLTKIIFSAEYGEKPHV